MTTTQIDLAALTPEQLTALAATVPILRDKVDGEFQRRLAFEDQDDAMSAVALVLAKVEHFKTTRRQTDIAKELLEDLGIHNLLCRLLATADVVGVIYKLPTPAQIVPSKLVETVPSQLVDTE